MRRRDPREGWRSASTVLAVLLLFLFAPIAAASPDSPVGIDVGVVVASNEGTAVDPALSSLKGKLSSMFNYTSYRMVDRLTRTLAVGETGEFGLPGNRSMRVTPAPSKGEKVRLAVQITEGNRNLLTTTLGLTRGGMVLVGGPPYQKGVLILIISAR